MDIKLNRLFLPYAWRRFVSPFVGFVLVLVIAGWFLVWNYQSELPTELFYVCNVVCIIALATCIIDRVCGPENEFMLNRGRVFVNVYKEKNEKGEVIYLLSISGRNIRSVEFRVAEYERPYKTDDADFFIYRLSDDQNWYHWEEVKGSIRLGKYVNNLTFILECGTEKIVNLVNWHDITRHVVDGYILQKDMYIPPKVDVFMTSCGEHIRKPDSYIVLRKKGFYQVSGYYQNYGLPRYYLVDLSSIILKDGNEHVILVWDWDKKKYLELYRKQCLNENTSSYVIENTSDTNHNAVRVLKFDEQTKKLNKEYEGIARCIDRHKGIVQGHDNQCYGAEDEED